MGRNPRLSPRLRRVLHTAAFAAFHALAGSAAAADLRVPFELNFIKGDTRVGAKVRVRVVGDSIHYSRTVFEPGREAVESSRAEVMDIRRKVALKRILGELPRFGVFGSCFGKDMRYYLIDTPGGRFYRSVPERSGRCYTDEPGIFPLLEDLDTFISPPGTPGEPGLSDPAAPRS